MKFRFAAALGVSLLGIVVLTGSFFLFTEPGLRLLAGRASVIAPGIFTVEEVGGRLVGPILLKGVRYWDGDILLEAADLKINWRPALLIIWKVDITKVYISRLTVHLPPPPEEEKAADTPMVIRTKVPIYLREGVVEDLTVHPAQGQPFKIQRIKLDGSIDRKGLAVQTLAVENGPFELDASGQLPSGSADPIDINFTWTFRPESREPFLAEGVVTGSREKLTAKHRLLSPFRSDVVVRLADPIGEPKVNFEATFEELSPETAAPGWPGGNLTGRLTGAGRPDSFKIEGSIKGQLAGLDGLTGTFSLAREGAVWQLEDVLLQVPSTGMNLSVTGRLDTMDEAAPLSISTRWENLVWPPGSKDPLYTSKTGDLSVLGRLGKYMARFEAHIQGRGVQTGIWTASGNGDEQGFDLEAFHFLLLSGDVRGQGSLQWQNGLSWQYSAQGSGLDPGLLWNGWPGRVSLAFAGSGYRKDGIKTVNLEVSDIGGTLRGKDLGGSLEVTQDGPLRRIGKLDLALGTTAIQAAGQLDDTWEIQTGFTSGDIGLLLSEAAGSVAGSVFITGPRGSPRFRAAIAGNRLAMGQAQAEGFKVLADGAIDPDATLSLGATVTGLSFGTRSAQVLTLQASGSWREHQIRVNAVDGSGGASLAVEGRTTPGTWAGEFRASLLDGSVTGSASVGLDEIRSWNAALKVGGVNPGRLWPDFGGDLSFRVSGEGAVTRPGTWSAKIDDLAGRLRDLPVEGSAEAGSGADGTALRKLDLQIGSARLEASGGITPAWDLKGELSIPSIEELTPAASGAANISLSVSGKPFSPRVLLEGSGEQLSFPPVESADLSLSAELGPGPEGPLDITLTADKMIAAERAIDRASLLLRGTLSSHSGTILVRSPLSDADIFILGKYGEKHWEGSLKGKVLEGAVNLSGKLDLEDPLNWNWKFNASDLNPARLYEDLPENLSISGNTTGEIVDKGAAAQVRVRNLSGFLRGQPLTGRIDLGVAPGELKLRTMDLGVGEGTFTLSGQLTSQWDLKWGMNVPDLSAVQADLGGAVAASGHVAGLRDAPRVKGVLKGQNLSYRSMRAVDVNVDADIDPDGSTRIEAGFAEMTAGKSGIQSVSMLAEGPLSSHGLSLAVRSHHTDADLYISGRYREGSWSGEITRWDIASKNLGQWSLADTASLALGDTIKAGPVCLGSDDSEACLQIRWHLREKEGGGSLRWTGLGLDLGEGWLPEGFNLEGSSDGDAQFSFVNGTTGLVGRIGTSPGSLSYVSEGVKVDGDLAVDFKRLGAEITLDTMGLRGRVEGDLGRDRGKSGVQEEQYLLWTFEIPQLALPSVQPPEDLRVKGQFKTSFNDLDLIEAITPEVSNVQGRLTADIAVGGLLRHPELMGEASLAGGSLKLITPGVTLDKVDLKTIISSDNEIKVSGSLTSGGGSLDLDGRMLLDREKGWPITLKLSGDGFEIARTPYISVLVSPDMSLELKQGEFKAEGTVRVPEASIEPADFSLASTPSADITVQGREIGEAAAQPVNIHADVTFELGKKISFNGFGLTSRIEGSLMVRERPGSPATATGELQILDGEYKAFGRTLAIERGRLIFTGGQIDNPGLDIRAVRQVNEVTAGVQVSGTLLSPVLTLFSEPALGESEILSYLVLGRPLSQATSGDAQVLSQAATAVSLAGGLAIAREIGNAFGLEEVKVETGEEAKDSTLVVGKYLSPRVYVQYGVGLFESINIFRFGYQLGRRFLLQGESGVESGADLIYTIEKK